MSMITSFILPRKFIIDNGAGKPEVPLADPGRAFNLDDVRSLYAATYPTLTTAQLEGPHINNDEEIYYFRASLGTKG